MEQQRDVRGPVELTFLLQNRNSALGPSLLLQDCDASRAHQPEMFGRLANAKLHSGKLGLALKHPLAM